MQASQKQRPLDLSGLCWLVEFTTFAVYDPPLVRFLAGWLHLQQLI